MDGGLDDDNVEGEEVGAEPVEETTHAAMGDNDGPQVVNKLKSDGNARGGPGGGRGKPSERDGKQNQGSGTV